jgi:transposase InsO family protein
MSQDENLLNLSWLCKIAAVSHSGYYRYMAAEANRKQREDYDREDFSRILEAYNYRSYAKGARSIYMRLFRQQQPTRMNIKKIRRLMDKYGLRCPIRKANPYRAMLRASQESRTAPYLLNREFREHGPRRVLLTDISYLFFGSGLKSYISTVIDAYTKQILAFALSKTLEEDFVLETINNLLRDHGISLDAETLINSDQGAHYKSYQFSKLLKDAKLRQSMSRKANCWDNSPQESLFGHMKDEIDLSSCRTHEDVVALLNDWIDYYNNDRFQWDLAKLSPNEYYEYCQTGIYPIKDRNE